MKRFVIIILISMATASAVYLYGAPSAGNNSENIKTTNSDMLITSQSFDNNGKIPVKFSCDGGNINPQLNIGYVPEDAKSLALIMDDPDASGGRTFTHWLVWNIDPKTSVIKEESAPPGLSAEAGAKAGSAEGKTSFGNVGYGGPCPPKGSKPHRYFFKLYALDVVLDLVSGSDKEELEQAMQNHILAQAELVGLYNR